ncbi:MAG: transglycosylase SLT domain-containing protein [Chloroflexota bacterium]
MNLTTWIPTLIVIFAPPLAVLLLRRRWLAWRRARISGLLISMWLVSLMPVCSVMVEIVALTIVAHEAAAQDVRTRTMSASVHDEQIAAAATRHQVDPQLVAAIIEVESAGNETAVSPAGALGIMQIMPDTARDLGLQRPFDAGDNIEAGTRYLAWLIDYFGGDVETAVMAYHGGPGRLQRSGPRDIDREYLRLVQVAYERQPVGTVRLPYAPGTLYTAMDNYPHGDGNWPGRDFLAPCGSPLLSPLDGWVERTGRDSYTGPWGSENTYLLITAGEVEVMMMHGRYSVAAGQRVQQGDLIGFVANEGNSSQCHDHISVRVNGRLVDILGLLAD